MTAPTVVRVCDECGTLAVAVDLHHCAMHHTDCTRVADCGHEVPPCEVEACDCCGTDRCPECPCRCRPGCDT